MMKIDDIKKLSQSREMAAEARFLADESKADTEVLELAFSSEAPYERYWGTEILGHGADEIDLSRLLNRAPLLLDHDNRINSQIGVVEDARIGSDGVARARVRLSRRPEVQAIAQDIRDGILGKVSVGYRINAMRLEEERDGVEVYRVTSWQPHELSLVAVPADDTVGVGRSITKEEVETMTAPADQAPVEQVHEEVKTTASPELDNPELETMLAVGRIFGCEDKARKMAALGRTLAELRADIYEIEKASLRSQPSIEVAQSPIVAAPHGRKLRAFGKGPEAERAAYASGMWIRAQLFGDHSARQWVEQNLTRVMTGSNSLKGGVLIPDPMLARVIELREEYGVARRLAEQVTMTADTLTIPRYKSGTSAYFVGEEDAITASDVSFDNVELVARKLAVFTRMSNDLLEDSVIDLADQVASDIARQFAQKEDECYFNGDGTSTYGGMIGVRAAILGTAGAVDAASGIDTLPEITAADLLKVMSQIPLYAQSGATWVMSNAAMVETVQKIQAAAGGNSVVDLGNGPVMQYQGYPVMMSQVMPANLTADYSNLAMILFGDFRMGSIMGTRRDISLRVDESRFMEYDQTAIRATERFDINVHGVGDASTVGPILALIGE